jgi:hypothetical protein
MPAALMPLTIRPRLVYGTGSSGSIARWLSAAGSTIANVFIAGPRSVSGRISSAPSASLPRYAVWMTANDCPRSISGRSSSGGKRSSFAQVEISSGRPADTYSCQACMTSRLRSNGKKSAPA